LGARGAADRLARRLQHQVPDAEMSRDPRAPAMSTSIATLVVVRDGVTP
jgi:hypothetical protein